MAHGHDVRLVSHGDIFQDIAGTCARALVSRDWYGHGNHRPEDNLAV